MAKRGKFNKKGFTLSEILIVVAVISILLALAVPNVIRYSRGLKLAELDDSAKAIYMAAQNRLNALIASGENVAESVGGALLTVETPPGGDVSTGSERSYVSSRALTSGGDPVGKCAYLVPAGSIEAELAGHYYVIEYNAQTGVVFAVWYWEDADDFDYETVKGRLVEGDTGYDEKNDPATRDYRLDHGMMVGCYGGTDVEREKLQQMPEMTVTLTNAEELVLDICIPDGKGMSNDDCLIDVEINGVPILEKCGLEPGPDNYGKVVLDTLKTYNNTTPGDNMKWTFGKSYKEWYDQCKDQNLNMPLPGRDIVVTVTLSHAENKYLPRVVKVAGNSLFAGLDTSDGGTVMVKYGRHLQNLDTSSGFNATPEGDPDIIAKKAAQTGDIDFNKEYKDSEGNTINSLFSWKSTYEGRLFTPITNDNLTEFNGNSYIIRSLNAGEDVIYGTSGLFSANYWGPTYENIVLINPKTSNALYSGALIGTIGIGTIDNCHVYLDAEGMEEARAGVLFIQGETAGGLVGMTAAPITNSSASVPVSGTETAGGLVGFLLHDIKVENCYSAGYVHSDGGTAGGLIGNAEGESQVINSYAAGEIDCNDAASIGGLVGTVNPDDPVIASNVYAAVRYTSTDKVTTDVYGLYEGNDTYKFVKQNGVKYADEIGAVGTASELLAGASATVWEMTPDATGNATSPYNLIPETQRLDAYPYPRLKGVATTAYAGVHYGDWLEQNNAALVYYEVREDGKVYINGKVVNDTSTGALDVDSYDTLQDDSTGGLVTEDGYGILLPGDDAILLPAVKVNGDCTLEKYGTIKLMVDGIESTYTLYTFENPLTALDSYYTLIEIGDYDYWYNPFFPCEVLTEEEVEVEVIDGTETRKVPVGPAAKEKVAEKDYPAGTVLIRSARHLANMELYVKESSSYNYEQLLNVDFTKYTGNYDGYVVTAPLNKVIPLASDHTYKGHGHTISNMTVNVSGDAGLFSSVAGTVSNVTLIDMKVSGANAGTLAGTLTGKIENCGSYASNATNYNDRTVTAAATGYAGGLIGQMTGGSVTGSYAAVKVSGGTAGGFVGSATGGTIENSFSGGRTENGIYTAETVNVTGTTMSGGFAGNLTGVTLSGTLYSTCSAQGPENSVGQFAGAGTPASYSDTLYAIGMTFSGSKPTVPVDGDKLTDPEKVSDTASANHYDVWADVANYPYTITGVAHHGDWPIKPDLKYGETLDATNVVTDDYYFLNGTPINTPYAMRPAATASVIGDFTVAADGKLSWDVHNCAPGETFYMTLYMNGYRAYFNPHFADTVVSTKPATSDAHPDEVKINSARQLANISKYTTGTATLGLAWKYAQGKDIDFAAYTGWTPQFTAGKSVDNRLTPANLTGGSYNGGSHSIRYLYTGGGLFGTVSSGSISDLTLINTSSVGGLYAGALAELVDHSAISNCGARIDYTKEQTEIERDYNTYYVTGTSYVGGLIGFISNGSRVESSYAAVKVVSNGTTGIVGGFAGVISGSAINNCYAGGHTVKGVYDKDSVNVTGETAGGFAGSVVDSPKSNFFGICYSTCSVSGSIAQGPFAGNPEGINPYDLENLFGTGALLGEGENKKDYSTPKSAEPGRPFTPHPYDKTLDDKPFPYASGFTEHYGDWSSNKLTFGVFYRDFCSIENKYEYYLKVWQTDENGKWPETPITIDRLCHDPHHDAGITEPTYGFFFAGGVPSSSVSSLEDTLTGTEIKNYLGNINTSPLIPAPAYDFDVSVLTDLKAYTVTGTVTGTGSETWTFDFGSAEKQEITVDYRFGAAFGNNTIDNRYQIRNAQQLQNITYLPGGFFDQTHDIPANVIPNFAPIASTSAFTGQYNGKGYQIQNLTIDVTSANSENNNAKAALFATANNNYLIENVVLVGGSISASNDAGKARAGGIVADSNSEGGTIRNCVVAVNFITASGYDPATVSTYAGGIAANFIGTITNCQVYTTISAESQTRLIVSGGDERAGGIVGDLNQNGSITLSYSGGQIRGNPTNSGGIAGYWNDGGGDITNCYTYMSGAKYAIDGRNRNTWNTCAYREDLYSSGGGFFNPSTDNGATALTAANREDWLRDNNFYTGLAVTAGGTYDGCTVTFDGTNYVHYGDTPWN